LLERAKVLGLRYTPSERLYAAGLAAAVVGIGLFPMATWLRATSAILTAAGFLFALLPLMRRAWGTWWGRLLLGLAHALVAAIALVLSRNLVADATGLPTGSFHFTVGAVAVVMYPLAWLVVSSLLALITATLIGLTSIALHVGSLFSRRAGRMQWSALLHFGGALSVALLACVSLLSLSGKIHLGKAIRHVAYVADYEACTRYPGVPAGKRVQFLEGGVVSYAEVGGNDVVITAEARK
jgi:hypothetical protein